MSAVPRTLTFGSGERRFLVAERLVPMSHVGFETMDAYAGQAALKRALANEPALAVGMQRTFTGLFPAQGLNACSLSALGCTATDMVARRSLVLIDMGPRPIMVASVDPKLAQPPPGERSFVSKLEAVVRGMTAVPRDRIAADARDDFDHLRRELLSATGVIATIVFVLAFWAASHVTGVGGLILDGVLIGIVWYAIGNAVFAWFDKLAALLFAIRDAKTEAQLAECSAKLVNLILEAGVTTFMTLITRAAGRRLPKVTGKNSGNTGKDPGGAPGRVEPIHRRNQTPSATQQAGKTSPPASLPPNRPNGNVRPVAGRTTLTYDKATQSWTSSGGLRYTQGSAQGNRVKHVLEHAVANPNKPVHSVFNVGKNNVLSVVDEAWARKTGSGVLQANGNRLWDVPMGRAVGTQGQSVIRVIVKDGTNQVITAFPK